MTSFQRTIVREIWRLTIARREAGRPRYGLACLQHEEELAHGPRICNLFRAAGLDAAARKRLTRGLLQLEALGLVELAQIQGGNTTHAKLTGSGERIAQPRKTKPAGVSTAAPVE